MGRLVGPDVWETYRELIPAGSMFAFLAEHREVLFPTEFFADMYPSVNGRPSLPPQVLAATVVLQSLAGLSDFEAVQEPRCDLRWKAACGVGLHDTVFDPSLLTYFRRRLPRSADPMRIIIKVKDVVTATGVLKGKQRRALDSTVMDDAVATQDTVTQIISAILRVIREVPGAGEIVGRWCTAHDYTDPGKPKIVWNDEAARAALADALVSDAVNLLGWLPEREMGEGTANAAGLLARLERARAVAGETSISTGPTSVVTVLARVPLRVLPEVVFSCLSCPRWSVIMPSMADWRILWVSCCNSPPSSVSLIPPAPGRGRPAG